MKRSIEWYQDCVKNHERSLEEQILKFERYVTREQESISRSKKDLAYTKAQIERAIREGRDGFDSEKFKLKGIII